MNTSNSPNTIETPNECEVGWSALRGYGWPDQYERMVRWRDRILEVQKSESHTLDLAIAFFQSCYHLHDWLKYTSTVNQSKLEQLIVDHFEIKICKDFCNASKHFSLTSPKLPNEFSLLKEYNPKRSGRFDLVILTDGKKVELFSLIEKCVDIWTEFITKHDPKVLLPEKYQRLFFDKNGDGKIDVTKIKGNLTYSIMQI